MRDRLNGKSALITGGSRGIGRAIAQRLATDGALVAIHYGGNDAAAKETLSAIEQAGGQAFLVRAELGVSGMKQDWSRTLYQPGEYQRRK